MSKGVIAMLYDYKIQNRDGYSLSYPAEKWEEATIIGNGIQGALIMGTTVCEEIILSHERLFAPVDIDMEPIPMAEHLPNIRKMINAGKSKEASETIVELYAKKHGKSEKTWTNPFIPAASLNILIDPSFSYSDYRRTLKFATGEAEVSYYVKHNSFRRKSFISRQDNCCVVFLQSSDKSSFSIKLNQTPYMKNGRRVLKEMFPDSDGKNFLKADTGTESSFVWYSCQYKNRDNGYIVVCEIINEDGNLLTRENCIDINETTNVILLVRTVPLAKMSLLPEAIAAERSRLREIVNKYSNQIKNTQNEEKAGSINHLYKNMLREHLKIHKERFERIELSLENQHLNCIFNSGRYAILSSSGELPPNLQGVWTGTYDAGWSSDYTQNGNLQTAIMGLLPTGDFESLHSFFNYQEENMKDYRKNSRVLYGCSGIHIPSRTSDTGLDFHFDEEWPMLFWTAGAAWAAHFYYDYWLYTYDHDFLETRALPFMREVACFYQDFLTMNPTTGYLEFNPSYSPENTPRNKNNAACINATMDISIAKELFVNLTTACRTAKIQDEEIQRWEKIIEKLPPYCINDDGALNEWSHPHYQDNYDHRHSSHLYMLYYDIPWYEEKKTLEACKKAYEMKMKFKEKEQGTMAFGLVQAGMAAAHLQDAKMTELMIKSMADNNYYRTYASAHDYGPNIFNTDISGGMPALMLECIAQSSPIVNSNKEIIDYSIRLLPALPQSMKTGEVKNMRLRGGFSLDLKWQNYQIIDYRIISLAGNSYQIVKQQSQVESHKRDGWALKN